MNIRTLSALFLLTLIPHSAALARPKAPASHVCATVVPDSLFSGVVLQVGSDSTICVKVTNCGDSLENFVADIAGVGYDVDQTFSGPIKPDSFFTYCITFHPQDFGVQPTTLNIRVAGTSLKLIVPLLGASPCAKLAASPDTLQFPPVANGTYDTLPVIIRNTGNFSWTPSSPQIGPYDGAFTILSFDTSSIPPGGSKQINVQFSPGVSGKDSCTLTFPNAGPCGNQFAIEITGEGACARLTNDAVVVPNTGVGEKKLFTFTVTNLGNLSWDPGNAVLSGAGASCYKIIEVVPVPLPPGSQATFTAEFSPEKTGNCCANLAFPNGGPCQDNVLSIDFCGVGLASGVKEIAASEGFTLEQNFPNPASSKTSFGYATPIETEVSVSLNDLKGNVVRTLIKGIVSVGNHLVNFDASNLPSGTYFYVLRSGSIRLTRELVLIK